MQLAADGAPDLTHFFVFLAQPAPSSDEYGIVDGAHVSCWVNEPVAAAAAVIAREFIENLGWDIAKLEETFPIAQDHYAANDPGHPYAEQARIDAIVVRFHTWDLGAPDK